MINIFLGQNEHQPIYNIRLICSEDLQLFLSFVSTSLISNPFMHNAEKWPNVL